MAEYKKGSEPVVLCVTTYDIPADYSRNDLRSLWVCGECWYFNYEVDNNCQRCGEARYETPETGGEV